MSPPPVQALAGRTVVVTRSVERSGELALALEMRGSRVVHAPSTRQVCRPASSPEALAVLEHGRFTHVVFTSPAAARLFGEIISAHGRATADWSGASIVAVGPGTARELERIGLGTHRIASDSTGAALARELIEEERLGPSHRVLLPQSSIARPELRELLEAAGVPVEVAAIYETRPEVPAKGRAFLELVERGEAPDSISFFSPSALEGFLEITGERGRAALLGGRPRIVSIGPTTSAALRDHGFVVAAECPAPSIDAVVESTIRAIEG